MLTIKNVRMLDGQIIQIEVNAERDHHFDAEGKFTVIPSLIDPHFHLVDNGQQADWKAVVKNAIEGGISSLCCIEDQKLTGSTKDALEQRSNKIDQELKSLGAPLKHHFYFYPDEMHLTDIGQGKKWIVGLGTRLQLDKAFEKFNDDIFRIAAQEDLIVIIDSDREDKVKRTKEAVRLTQKYSAQVYFLDIGTAEELEIVRQARRSSLLAYTGTSAEHLFGGGRHQDAIWRGVQDGTIDTVGSGHGPQHLEGMRNLLPQLLKALKTKKIQIAKLIAMTRMNPANMFRLPRNEDLLLVDLDKCETGYIVLAGNLLDCKKGLLK